MDDFALGGARDGTFVVEHHGRDHVVAWLRALTGLRDRVVQNDRLAVDVHDVVRAHSGGTAQDDLKAVRLRAIRGWVSGHHLRDNELQAVWMSRVYRGGSEKWSLSSCARQF